MNLQLETLLQKHAASFHSVVPFNKTTDSLFDLHFASYGEELITSLGSDTTVFAQWMSDLLKEQKAKYAIGGYKENRSPLYARSKLFDDKEPRTIHLGIDIWGDAGTPVYAPLGGMVHSFAFNNQLGDYGVTIILQHQLQTVAFYTLYGHLSLKDIETLRIGQFINRGHAFAHFGNSEENGNWPPHLHFQVIKDMRQYEGDYPGVCKMSELKKYVENSPDPSSLLNFS